MKSTFPLGKLLFRGRRHIVESWHRFYDPSTGRYITADPIGLAGGINLYAYVGGNPVNWIDPEGLKSGSGYPYNGPGWGGTANLPFDNGPQRAPGASETPSPYTVGKNYFVCDFKCYDWDPINECCRSQPVDPSTPSFIQPGKIEKCLKWHYETVIWDNGRLIRPEANHPRLRRYYYTPGVRK